MTPPPGAGRRQFLCAGSHAALAAAFLAGGLPALAGCSQAGRPARTAGASSASNAASDRLFQAGHFAQADQGYASVLADDPGNVHALIQRAAIALLGNRLGQARDLLASVLGADPGNPQATQMLALAFYRGGYFAQAARYGGAGGMTPQLLGSFHGLDPYEIHGPDTIRVPFLQTRPVLLVDVAVNGCRPMPFTVDTGANTIGLYPGLAQRAGVALFPPPALPPGAHITGAGGSHLSLIQLARVDSIRIGSLEIRHVPGSVGTSAGIGMHAPDGRPVQGFIGTTLLSHFLATLDYPRSMLALSRQAPAAPARSQAPARTAPAAGVPFWIYSDHFLLTMGAINGRAPVPLMVDTGSNADYGSMALLPASSTVKTAGITAETGKPLRFAGSGGTTTAYPLRVSELAIGRAARRDLPGMAGVFSPPQARAGTITPVLGGAVSSAFFEPYALTIDTTEMRLTLSAP